MTAFRSFSAVVLGLMLVATVGVFTFMKPEPPGYGKSSELKVPTSPAPDDGWTWSRGTPGWDPAEMSDDLREFYGNIWTTDLAPARAAARSAGVDPTSIRVLRSMRVAVDDGFLAIVAGSDSSGRTCLGFVVPRQPVSFTCPQSQVAFVVAAAMPAHYDRPTWPSLKAREDYSLFLMGIARGDVVNGFAGSALGSQRVYDRSSRLWGTFEYSGGAGYVVGHEPSNDRWRARAEFYGPRGRMATLHIRLNRPGYTVFSVR